MKSIVIIPARLASSRLPNKPLLKIHGKSMIALTAEKVLASGLSPVIIATESSLVFDEIEPLKGVIPVLTSLQHTCGTERVLEAYEKLKDQLGECDVIVNVQGDEPFIDPRMFSELMRELGNRRNKSEFWTTVTDLPDSERDDRNVAKVVMNLQNNALIFSRDPIKNAYKHTSVYIYTPKFLQRFCRLPPSPLEDSYRLEQMRALDHGFTLNCIWLPYDAISINTVKDLKRAAISDYELYR